MPPPVLETTVDESRCTIDEVGPMTVVRPGSVADLGAVIRQAATSGQALYPLGGRTMLDLGLPPQRAGTCIDLTGLTQVIDYPARDMTITVQSGIRIAELQRLLATEGQRLPIDVPQSDRATLGGVLATNTSGPRRLGAGTPRDYVIGITTVNDEGQETKAGGRVVKNVAGYDLCKLHVGALGTLGVISQVTLKVRPLPESQALVTFGCDAASLEDLLARGHASRTRPTCIDLLDARAAHLLRQQTGVNLPDRAWIVVVGFEDSELAVTWQIQQLLRELTSAGVKGVEAMAATATEPLWQALTELTTFPQAKLSLRANLLPGHVASWCALAASQPGEPIVHAHAASGIVRVHFRDVPSVDRARSMLNRLTDEASAARGNVVLSRCPSAWKRDLPVWGRARGDVGLMRQVKQQLDPRRLFNPGRFLTD